MRLSWKMRAVWVMINLINESFYLKITVYDVQIAGIAKMSRISEFCRACWTWREKNPVPLLLIANDYLAPPRKVYQSKSLTRSSFIYNHRNNNIEKWLHWHSLLRSDHNTSPLSVRSKELIKITESLPSLSIPSTTTSLCKISGAEQASTKSHASLDIVDQPKNKSNNTINHHDDRQHEQ